VWYFDVTDRDILGNSKLWPSPSYRNGEPRADGLVDLQLQWNRKQSVKITMDSRGDSSHHLATPSVFNLLSPERNYQYPKSAEKLMFWNEQ
jgi:hypothetical protein